jgi:hypothetical protein
MTHWIYFLHQSISGALKLTRSGKMHSSVIVGIEHESVIQFQILFEKKLTTDIR